MALLGLLCAGCASVETQRVHTFTAKGVSVIEEPDRAIGAPALDWDTIVEGTGTGLPAANVVTAVEKKLTALLAAKYGALADLAENLRGMQVARESQVNLFRVTKIAIAIETTGFLEGVKITQSAYDEDTEIAGVTVQIGLDSEGNIIPQRLLPIAPLSLTARRARAEAAARIDASASLLEQVGEVHVGQVVQVKGLILHSQRAWAVVDGMIRGAKFSMPTWPTHEKCIVEATLEIGDDEFNRLRAVADMPRR